MKNKLVINLLAMVALISSCTHDPQNIAEFEQICFTDEILPIFKNNCTMSNCHNSGSSAGGFVFTDYNSIMEAIKPYDPKGSEGYSVLSNVWFIMPPDGPLPQISRTKILIWIEQGALNTTCPDTTTLK